MVKIAIFIILTIATLSFAEDSPNPIPSLGEKRKPIQKSAQDKNQENSTPDAQGKDFSPANFQAGAPVSGQNGQDSSNYPYQSSSDDRIVWLTAALVFVGIAQVVVYALQARYVRQGLEITRQAAQATQISANAAMKSAIVAETTLRITERPYLSISRWELVDFTPEKDAQARCFFVNTGRRPAKLKKNFCNVCFSEKLPPIPDYTQIVPTYEGEPLTVHRGIENVLSFTVPVRTADYKPVERKEMRLYFYGCFIYDDMLDGEQEHRTTFFAWYDFDKKQFSQVYDLGYNTSD